MYKKIIISISVSTTLLLLNGCGSQTPTESILSEIDAKNVSGEKNVANLIFDYYKRAKNNIHKQNCSALKTDSDNTIDKSIIELSTEYCDNDSGLETKMKSILTNINNTKSMAIKFEQIDGTTLYVNKGFTLEEARVLKSANIDLNTIEKYKNLFNDTSYVVKFAKVGINYQDAVKIIDNFDNLLNADEMIQWISLGLTPDDMIEWKNARLYANSMRKRYDIIKNTHIKDVNEWKKWNDNRVYTYKKWKAWKDAGVSNIDEYLQAKKFNFGPLAYKRLSEAGLSLKEYAKWHKLGLHGSSGIKVWEILKSHHYADLNNFLKFEDINYDLFGILKNAVSYNDMNDNVWKKFIDNKEKGEQLIDKLGGVNKVKKWKNWNLFKLEKIKNYGFTYEECFDNQLGNSYRLVSKMMALNIPKKEIIKAVIAVRTNKFDSGSLLWLLTESKYDKTLNYDTVDKAVSFLKEINVTKKELRTYRQLHMLNVNDIKNLEPFHLYRDDLSALVNKAGLKTSIEIKEFLIKNKIDTERIGRFGRMNFGNTSETYRKNFLKWAKKKSQN